MLFLELNEFSLPLLEEAVRIWHLPHFEKLLQLHRAQTHTEDTYESDFLEPWVQWVSVHTGIPSKQHKIQHLGDVPQLGTDQLWETLSDWGITSGIWSPMNASRGRAERCLFFMPDPWTASEQAYPQELNRFLDPLRYISKNYLDRSSATLFRKMRGFWKVLRERRLLGFLLRKLPGTLWNALRFGGESFVWIALAEALTTELFLRCRAEAKPQFSLLFLNTLAHLQHHHWHEPSIKGNKRLKAGLQQLDAILGRVLDSLEAGTPLYVANALSQMNTHHEKAWVLYRQFDQAAFLQAVAIPCERVEAHMTHDAHLYFASKEACQYALEQLRSAQIGGQPLFYVESYPQDPCKLFYKLTFTDQVAPDATFTLGGRSYRFADLFQKVVTRTGRHIQSGTVLSNQPLPPTLHNHEIFSLLLQPFAPPQRVPGQKSPALASMPPNSLDR